MVKKRENFGKKGRTPEKAEPRFKAEPRRPNPGGRTPEKAEPRKRPNPGVPNGTILVAYRGRRTAYEKLVKPVLFQPNGKIIFFSLILEGLRIWFKIH